MKKKHQYGQHKVQKCTALCKNVRPFRQKAFIGSSFIIDEIKGFKDTKWYNIEIGKS